MFHEKMFNSFVGVSGFISETHLIRINSESDFNLVRDPFLNHGDWTKALTITALLKRLNVTNDVAYPVDLIKVDQLLGSIDNRAFVSVIDEGEIFHCDREMWDERRFDHFDGVSVNRVVSFVRHQLFEFFEVVQTARTHSLPGVFHATDGRTVDGGDDLHCAVKVVETAKDCPEFDDFLENDHPQRGFDLIHDDVLKPLDHIVEMIDHLHDVWCVNIFCLLAKVLIHQFRRSDCLKEIEFEN